LRKKKSI